VVSAARICEAKDIIKSGNILMDFLSSPKTLEYLTRQATFIKIREERKNTLTVFQRVTLVFEFTKVHLSVCRIDFITSSLFLFLIPHDSI
jgi:hypothetical protein